jgi:hypothetical protein
MLIRRSEAEKEQKSGYRKDEHATPDEFRSGIRMGPSFSIVRRHSSSLHGVIRARFASQPPPSFAFKGRLGFEALGCSAGLFLCRRRELHQTRERGPSPNGASKGSPGQRPGLPA